MRFSEEALARFLEDSLCSSQWDVISQHGMLTCATYSVACCAILQALGLDWTQKHIGRSAKACDYFKTKNDDRKELLRYMSRATEFGELIYNLYDIDGFEERINTIRANAGPAPTIVLSQQALATGSRRSSRSHVASWRCSPCPDVA